MGEILGFTPSFEKCPFSKLHKTISYYKSLVLEFLGKPSLSHKNSLLKIGECDLISLLNDISANLSDKSAFLNEVYPIEIHNSQFEGSGYPITNLSQLGVVIFMSLSEKFPGILSSKRLKVYNNNQETDKLLNLLLIAIQAYDVILIHIIKSVETLDDYNKLLPETMEVILKLASLPDLVSQNIVKTLGGFISREHQYNHFRETLGEISISEFGKHIDYALVTDKSSYGVCPALADGMIRKVFDILAPLYGKCYITNK